jgi:UDP-N-acetylglucosamine:LPS N-acetylglucosamine transferase
MKLCLVSSCGGHLSELRALEPAYGRYPHFYVLDERIVLPHDMEGKTLFVLHAERTWRLLVNLWEAWSILRRERPDLMLSTGAGVAVPFGLVGRLRGIPFVFVETGTRVHRPSLSGRIMYWLASRFFYQWPELSRSYPKGTFGGLLL